MLDAVGNGFASVEARDSVTPAWIKLAERVTCNESRMSDYRTDSAAMMTTNVRECSKRCEV